MATGHPPTPRRGFRDLRPTPPEPPALPEAIQWRMDFLAACLDSAERALATAPAGDRQAWLLKNDLQSTRQALGALTAHLARLHADMEAWSRGEQG